MCVCAKHVLFTAVRRRKREGAQRGNGEPYEAPVRVELGTRGRKGSDSQEM